MLALLLTLHVHAAASLTDAMRDIGASFTRMTGIAIEFNFAASNTIARQIENGAPGDVFVSADEAQMNAVAKFVRGRRDVISNRLVVIGPPSIRSARDLLHVERIALGDPRMVPAGVYARQYLTRAGLWTKLQSKIIPTENVRAAVAAVKSGNADAAIVYRSDVKSWRVLLDEPPHIVYPAAILRESANPKQAEEFVNYLTTSEAQNIFARHGFDRLHR